MPTLPLLGERYRLGPVVGTGGMGTVHRAWDERFDREVAVKVVRAGADTVEQERLRREAQYLAQLDHPNLIAVYDAGADRGRHGETVWFAMELVHGPDLRRVIATRGRLSTADVVRVLSGAAGALGALHRAGVVHRDLKPANVLLTADPDEGRWEAKLADLGIARLIRADALTMTGQVVGTAAYLSPEQVSGGEVGPASDVYSLGLLAIEALTGRVVFPGPVAEAAAARLVRSPEVPAGLDPGWRALLGSMTARRPADRPTTEEILRRCGALVVADVPLEDAVERTLVMPASDVDLPTEAMDLAGTRPIALAARTTGWTPALRRRPAAARRRRTLLGAAAIAVAAALAGGGASVIGLASTGSTSVAAPVPSHGATHVASPRPSAKPSRSPSTAPSREPVVAKKATAAVEQPSQQQRAAVDRQRNRWRERAQQELRRLQDRLDERLRDRLHGHR